MVENSIASAEAELKKAQGGNLPTLDGFASYQYDKGFELDGSGDSWMAGIKVDYNLYQGNRTNANIALAKSQLLHRITSYNVCYTKLLRRLSRALSSAVSTILSVTPLRSFASL